MIIKDYDTGHIIKTVSKNNINGKYSITWKSEGFDNFLVFFGSSTHGVDINSNEELKSELSYLDSFIKSGESELRLPCSTEVFSCSFNRLIKNGGFDIGWQPGVYAVYGYTENDGELCIYKQIHNFLQFKVDILIREVPVYRTVGFFRKKTEYAGYHEIKVLKGISGMDNDLIYYSVEGDLNRYPLPAEVISGCGKFYVKSAEQQRFTFGTENTESINIQIQGEI